MSYFELSFYKPLKEILKKNNSDIKSNKKLNTKGGALSLNLNSFLLITDFSRQEMQWVNLFVLK